MKKLLLVLFLLSQASAFAGAEDILGVWWSPEKKTKIEITQKDKEFFGKIIAVRPESKEKTDSKNPDSNKRSQKILGLELLKGFEYNGDRWVDGTIYDPENGKTYKCIMWFGPKDTDLLYIRGYIGFALLGRTAEFKRVKGENPQKQQDGEPERYYGE